MVQNPRKRENLGDMRRGEYNIKKYFEETI